MSISIVGMGMGTENMLAAEAKTAIYNAGLLIGAERLLASLPVTVAAPRCPAVAAADIAALVRQHPCEDICILMSGDVGFYSGATRLLSALEGQEHRLIPGISSVQYFAAKLKRPWQDWKLVSAHAQSCDVISPVRCNEETFFLTGQLTVREICTLLTEAGFGRCAVTVGENLGSDSERIKTDPAEALAKEDFAPLSVLLVENPAPCRLVSCGLPDETFIRGDIPMTKSEVRSVVLSKLRLRDDDILYDIGAGTGSVSVEAALLLKKGRVYAFEREREGCRLIMENAAKHGAGNLTLIEGEAPVTFNGLPTPTAAFVGGSGGNLEDILGRLLSMNPKIRLVVSAVALETLEQASSLFFRLPLQEVEVVQLAVSRARKLGAHHLMTAQNPIYLFSAAGSAPERSL